MGFHSASILMDGTIQNLASELSLDRQPATELTFFNITGNDPVNVGGPEQKLTLSATIHGFQVLAGAADGPSGIAKIGPFSSTGAPLDLKDVYVLGSNNERLGIAWVSP